VQEQVLSTFTSVIHTCTSTEYHGYTHKENHKFHLVHNVDVLTIGAAIGTAVGAGTGALIGKKMDKAAAEAKQIEGALVGVSIDRYIHISVLVEHIVGEFA